MVIHKIDNIIYNNINSRYSYVCILNMPLIVNVSFRIIEQLKEDLKYDDYF